MKRVASFAWIENCCQLMMAPGVLVIDSVLPCVAKGGLAVDDDRTYGIPVRGLPGKACRHGNHHQLALQLISFDCAHIRFTATIVPSHASALITREFRHPMRIRR